MKYKVGDKVKVKSEFDFYEEYRGKQFVIEECDSSDDTYLCHPATGGYRIWFSEEKIEPVVSTLAEIKEKKLTCCINVKNIAEAQFLDDFFECKSYLKKYCENAYKERMRLRYYRILEDGVAFQLTDGVINDNCSANFYRSCGGRYGEVYEFSDLFPVGSTMMCDDRMYQRTESGITNYKLVPKYKEGGIATLKSRGESVSFASAPYLDLSLILPTNSRELEEKINKELANHFNAFPNDGISAKNGGKNSMKFTFYVAEGYRIDKSNNTRIPTMTTEVLVNGKDYQYGGSATCDKTDYSEREGVLNAIANAVCGGNFDREFNKVMKNKAFANKKSRTCTYCGQLFDTVTEKEAHEAWHVERRKARRERYLLRKRAKEIAFEEQAQKMAKEMIAENKKEVK